MGLCTHIVHVSPRRFGQTWGRCAGHRAFFAQRPGARLVPGVCRNIPQYPGAAAVADVVPDLHRVFTRYGRGLGGRPVLLEQGRLEFSDSRLGQRPPDDAPLEPPVLPGAPAPPPPPETWEPYPLAPA